MKLTYLTLLMVCNSLFVFAQRPFTIKGSVTDTMATYKLVNTTVILLNQKDSTLVKFTRANAEGSFAINNLHSGKFILLITYPGYADYIENFTLDTFNSVKDFGNVNLVLKSTLLEGVIINGKAAAITIKGDTTEFNAGSYNIQPNSKVEDLLKQLPGIQIDKDGKITAQGQKVNKVLVDGEEFFGDDPTLVTKNLRGDMIDKIQLYDKKSDQATFTGIDDGQKSKTINLKLKEDKKNGLFGTLKAGVGTKGFYENQATINVFKGKQKYAAYGSLGNTNELMGGNMAFSSVEVADDGGISVSGLETGDDDMGGGATGISIKRNSGLHYENKWKDKYNINTNYKLGSVSTTGETNDLSINALPGKTITTSSDQASRSFVFNQKLDGTLNMQLDSSAMLKVSISGSLKNNDSSDEYKSSTQREDNSLLNSGNRTVSNEGDSKAFNATAFWAKKFRKKGRTISVDFKQSFNEITSSGYLNSTNKFTRPENKPDSIVIIDQLKTNNAFQSKFSSNATYTEPISKDFAMILNYGLSINNSNADKKSFNKNLLGNYEDLDSLFSNNFKLDQLSNSGGLNFNYRKGKSVLVFGTKLSAVRFKQFDAYADTTLKRNFINWSPQINYSYNFSRTSSLQVNYNGNTTQPGIEQIQPYRANTDPLYIVLGNPGLKPSFDNNIRLSYTSFKMLSEQVLMINGSFSFTSNPITNNTLTDEAGKTTSQAINLSSHTPVNFQLDVNTGRKIKGINFNMAANTSGSFNYSLSNGSLNTSRSFNYSIGPSVMKYQDKYRISVSLTPSYNTSSTSLLGVKTNNDSYGANGSFDFMLRLPGKIEISTNGAYQYTGKSQAFNESLNRLVWNAAIDKKFLKDQSLRLSLTGRDLLNQNSGFSRSVVNNIINQSTNTTIQRYFILSLSWDFNKLGGS